MFSDDNLSTLEAELLCRASSAIATDFIKLKIFSNVNIILDVGQH
jgi:hypothetical protein